ncbi:hypothetical protein V500_05381 [Pseudogymnoascus sp. VKM F-4518 (FW-2643)]|nr:hypothetical protein V500_05381 [Pseudogymnoascus sp. VKM F-4518 (FW-2643)]
MNSYSSDGVVESSFSDVLTLGTSPTGRSDESTKMTNACAQCHRQKQKCNREQPCSNCVRRSIPHQCVSNRRPERRKSRTFRQDPYQGQPASFAGPASIPSTPAQQQTIPGNFTSRTAKIVKRQTLGRLFKARGAASYHGDFYFGHQSAASMVEATTQEVPSGIYVGHSRGSRIGAAQPFRNERGPYAQLWELIGSLPRQKATVDHLTARFFQELNPTFDSVHEESFMTSYSKFWDRKTGCDDLTNVDIRWLAVLFIILAFGELLDCPQPCSAEAQRECEDSSLHFYWASRKSLVIAPSFYGESTDLTCAGILITRYLVYARRISESWLTISFAIRMAQAQGMHVDGDQLDLPRKVTETRRRLWSQLYDLDRSIALALGRPYAINDRHCFMKQVENVWVDDMTDEQAENATALSLDTPTPSVLIRFQHQLAVIIGQIQEQSFTFSTAPLTSSASYDEVLKYDEALLTWKDSLPPYFRLEHTDLSLDLLPAYSFIPWHRLYLHTAFHFARITLHRSYLLRPSITDRFQYSRNACMSSACADLKIKLSFRYPDMASRLKSNVASHQLFNSALILGVIVVRDPQAPQAEAILDDLQAYCAKQNSDPWINEIGFAEVRVVELCISRARQARQNTAAASPAENTTSNFNPAVTSEGYDSSAVTNTSLSQGLQGSNESSASQQNAIGETFQYAFQNPAGPQDPWSDFWSNPAYFFPEAMDYQIWEGLVDDLAAVN